jgi:hypothetical protein
VKVCLLVFMYVGEYLNGLTSASVTVSGFHEADVNCDIQLIWADQFHTITTITY